MAEIFDLQVRYVVKAGERGWHHPIAPLFTLAADKRIVGKRLALAQCAVALAFDPFTADGQVLHGMPVIRAGVVLLQPSHLCHAWVLGQWGRTQWRAKRNQVRDPLVPIVSLAIGQNGLITQISSTHQTTGAVPDDHYPLHARLFERMHYCFVRPLHQQRVVRDASHGPRQPIDIGNKHPPLRDLGQQFAHATVIRPVRAKTADQNNRVKHMTEEI